MASVARRLAGMLAAAILLCAGNLCINASKVRGEIPYISITVTLLIEVAKLLIMLVVVAVWKVPMPRVAYRELGYYALPSFLYMIDNNLTFSILRFIDPATLSVLWNLKILATAILFRLVLKRTLTELRKIAILLLLLGVVTSQSDHINKEALRTEAGPATISTTTKPTPENAPEGFVFGLVLVLVGVTLSSCASVFTEWTFKQKHDAESFIWQSTLLYVFGVICNGLAVVADWEVISKRGFFDGYSSWTLVIIGVHCVSGICMGLILKFLDNIACVYAHAIAMMLTMLFSMAFFHFSPSLEFICGLSVLVVSMYLYHHHINEVMEREEEALALASANALASSGSGSSSEDDSTISISDSDVPDLVLTRTYATTKPTRGLPALSTKRKLYQQLAGTTEQGDISPHIQTKGDKNAG